MGDGVQERRAANAEADTSHTDSEWVCRFKFLCLTVNGKKKGISQRNRRWKRFHKNKKWGGERKLVKVNIFLMFFSLLFMKLSKWCFWPAATDARPVRLCPMLSRTVKERRYGVSDWENKRANKQVSVAICGTVCSARVCVCVWAWWTGHLTLYVCVVLGREKMSSRWCRSLDSVTPPSSLIALWARLEGPL